MSSNKVNAALLCETSNYHFVSKERTRKKGGGLGILLDMGLKHKHRPDLELKLDKLEHIVVKIKGDKEAILLVSCYQAPNTDQTKFLESYSQLLQKLKAENAMIIIDNIFSHEFLHDKCHSFIIIDDISDHLECICFFENFFPTRRCEQTVCKRSLTEKNIAKIRTDLLETDWSSLLDNNQTCDGQFDIAHTVLTGIMNRHAPEEIIRVISKQISEPWLTKSLIKCQRKQYDFFRKTLKFHNNDVTTNNVTAYQNYQSVLQCCK